MTQAAPTASKPTTTPVGGTKPSKAEKPAPTVAPDADANKPDSIGRVPFPAKGSADPKVYPFGTREITIDGVTRVTAIPEGFDKAEHQPLGKKDFKEVKFYYLMRAELAEAEAARYRKAYETGTLSAGATGGKSSVKKLEAMVEKTSQMFDLLKAQGVDLTALMAKFKADVAAAAAPAPAATK